MKTIKTNSNKVLIILTGGTIAMKSSGKLGILPADEFSGFLKSFPQLKNAAKIDVIEFSNIPSPYMTPDRMLSLAKLIKQNQEKYKGIVVTHGTDTMEETAYLCDLVLDNTNPVVFTAAMRSGSDLGLDGPRNIIGAVRVAIHKDSVDKGVLIVMNDEIHTAKDVMKTDTGKIDSFMSPGIGPLGYIDPDRVVFYRQILSRDNFPTDTIMTNVDLIKSVSGMDARFIRSSVRNGAKAIVIEAMGRGNLPDYLVPEIRKALQKNILVVITSRAHTGRVLPEYGYVGGGKNLQEIGAILAGDIQGIKARLKLMVLFGKYNNPDIVRKRFLASVL